MKVMARVVLAFAVVSLFGCKPDPTTVDGGSDAGSGTDAGVDAGMPLSKTLTLHYHRARSDYAGWNASVTAGSSDTTVTSASTDPFGAVYTVALKDGAASVAFSLVNGTTTDDSGALSVDVSGTVREAWVFSALPKAITHTPLALPSTGKIALYYQRPDMAYSGFGLHLWGDQVTGTDWMAPLQPVGTDSDLGSAFVVSLASGGGAGNCPAGKVCLIMHSGDTKDPGSDMQWDRSVLGDIVFLTSGSAVLTTAPRKAGAVDVTGAAAHLLSRDTVAWNVTDAAATSFELRYSAAADIKVTDQGVTGGQVIHLTARTTGLPAPLAAKAPNLGTWRAFDIAAADLASVPAALKGQLIAISRKADGALFSATRVQTAFALDDLYATTSEPLGPTFATVAGIPSVHVWAPTAQTMKLHVYDAAKAEITGSPFAMTASAKGVWSATGDATWYGKFYRFELTAFHPATDHVETMLVTDPYSTSLSMNSKYSQFADLADPALAPAGWGTMAKPALAGPQDVVLYEGHVRDFSALDTTVPAAHRGRFLAFTDTTGNGMKHLQALAAAGLTHLHLLPVFDIATVDEDPSKRVDLSDQLSTLCAKVTTVPAALCTQFTGKTIAEAMAALPGDSESQQAIATAMHTLDSFNWGYDPFHYGVPEGSYASTADGTARILEFRQMVAGLSQAGLRVVMDVVYNHTNSSGLTDTSVLDKVVPGYYHRLDEMTGTVLSSTCCANTATEHAMMQRLMVDTLVRWARDYKVDGFRFDLMGHHMKQNMVDAKTALQALTTGTDGVDGSKIILYGEGWDFGEVANNARGTNAVQKNMGGTGIGTFNDRIRDGIRGGSAFDSKNDIRKNQGFATGLLLDPNELAGTSTFDMNAARDTLDKLNTFVRIGMAGNLANKSLLSADGYPITGNSYGYNGARTGYTAIPTESVNYCSAHDNQTLWDVSQYKLPTGTAALERARIQLVALAPIALGAGMPFFHMGDDLLRSKSMERDSYDSGDWFNRIDWTANSNGWKSGMPNSGKDSANWPLITTIYADATTTPNAAAIAQARDRFRELLRERKSTPLLRLATEGDVMTRVDFLNSGTTQVRGLIVMTVSDGPCAGADLDPARDGIVVLINAGKTTATFTLTGATGLTLHPADAASADPVARTSTFVGGTFTIPAHTTAVFEKLQSGAQAAGVACNSH